MIRVQLDSGTIARTRIAASPAADVLHCLRLTVARRRDPLLGDPGPAARSALLDRDVALVAQVLPATGRGCFPDFLTPRPDPSGTAGLEGQLDVVAHTSYDEVSAQVVGGMLPTAQVTREVRRSVEDGTFARRSALGLAKFWSAALRDDWRHLRRSLDLDIEQKTRLLAERGVGAVLNSVNPDVTFADGVIEVDMLTFDLSYTLADADLVLAPGHFTWPDPSPQFDSPDNYVLRYPVATRAQRTGPPPAVRLAALMGDTRSKVLLALDEPMSTTDVASSTRISSATASYHLAVLFDSGLVERRREQYVVLYYRSSRGDLLAS